jgi:hypothetical protein
VSEHELRAPRIPEYRLAQQTRPRSLVGQVSTVLFQPGVFFRTLPTMQASRHWLVVALLILALAGIAAVRQASLVSDTSAGGDLGGFPSGGFDPSLGGDPRVSGGGGFEGVPLDGGISAGGDFGGPPVDGAGSSDVSATWTTALIAAAGIVVAWLIQALLLSEVTLFKGRLPSLGRNFQIAVWASLPMALMAALQLLYYAAGGTPKEAGLAGLITEWPKFAEQTPTAQALLLSLSTRLTLFWLWSLILLYFGARHALKGRVWTSLFVVVAWVVVLVVVPVATGTIKAPETATEIGIDGEMPFDPSMQGSEFPSDTFDPSLQGGAIEGESPLNGQGGEGAPVTEGDVPQREGATASEGELSPEQQVAPERPAGVGKGG